jgi:hypothetical protein
MIDRHGSNQVIVTQFCQLDPQVLGQIDLAQRQDLIKLIISEPEGLTHKLKSSPFPSAG